MSGSIIWLFVAVVVVGALFLIMIAMTRKPSKHLNQEAYRERWMSITGSVTSDAGSQQLAILNADKLLDQALRERGISGETMGERLKNAKHLLHDDNSVWTAHKLRNRIAHEDNVRLNPIAVRKALAAIKAALKDVGAL